MRVHLTKLTLSILCLALLLPFNPSVQAAPPPQSDTTTLTLTNDSDQTICFVQIASTTSDTWGDTWLDGNETVTPGGKAIFEVQPDNYDVRLLDCDNNTLLEKRNLSITGAYDLPFTGPDPCVALNQEGMLLSRQARYPDALAQFQQASVCYQEVGDRFGEGNSLNNIGSVYSSLGQYESAMDNYQQALTIRQETGDLRGVSENLNNIGLVYSSLGQHKQALDYHQQALTIKQEIGDRSGEGKSLNNIGFIYDNLGQYKLALDYYQQALIIMREIGDRFGEGITLNNIGFIYNSLGEYKPALDYHQQALTISQEIGNRSGEGTALNNIGVVYKHLSQYEPALDYYQQALTIMREIGDHSGEGGSLNNIGSIYSSLGQYKPALDYYQQALTISQEVGDRSGEGKSLHNIGFIYHSLGQYEPALDYFQQALIIVREIGDRSWEGVNLNNIGGIYSSLGQTKLALDNYQQALTISQEIGDHSGEGVTLNNIGRIHDRLGQYELALDNYQQALTISQEIGNRSSEGVVLHNIGGIYTSLEQYEPALNYHQQALTIRQEIGDRSGEGVTLNGIGGIYARLEQPEAALDYYQQALVISQEIGDRSSEGTALNNIGVVYDNLGQYELALDYYQQAIDIFEAVRTEAGSEQGRAEFIAQYADLYHWTVDLFHQQDQAEEAFSTTERGRARTFLDSMATGQVRLRDDDAAELLVQEQELHAQRLTIRFALTEARAVNPPDPDSVADLEIQLAKAEAAYAAVQDAIAARGAALASLVPGRSKDYVLGVAQVQARLDTQTTLVSYYVLEDKVLAFLITSDNFEIIPLEISPEALETQITAFRDFANLAVAHPESAVTLYHWLIEPLKHHLTKPYLAIIPHSILHYLPFAALTDGERYLIDDYTITTLPSASALPFIQENARSSAISSQRSPVILGNPTTGDFDAIASFPTERDKPSSLPSAEKEANAIAELFGVEPLIGEAATESAVRKQASEANILHLAAHGKFNQDAPLYSLIALAPDDTNDGWLTVGESYGLNLENTDLVVLSACETNLGDLSAGDELVGLTRAFIFAGTPSVIASLWAVEDETTSLLMERFYTHLRDGMGKAAALRQAQLDVREEYPNPYYWSAFVLSGDGGEVEESAPSQRTSNVSTPVNPEEKQSGSERLQPVTLNNPLISSIVLVGLVGLIFTGAIGVLGWRWRRRHLRMSKQKLLQHRLRKLQNERLRLQSTPASPSRARALKYITRELQEIEQQLGKTNKGKREINTP